MAANKIKLIGEILQAKSEEIYENGGLSPTMWEELTGEEVLGRIAVSASVARAIVAQIRNLEDTVLGDMIVEGILNADFKDKVTKKQPAKGWLQALKEELTAKSPGSVLRGEAGDSESTNVAAPVTVRPRVEFKLELYEGTEEGCAVWFHGLERQMAKLKIGQVDYLIHAINSTAGKARAAIVMLDDRYYGDYKTIKDKMVQLFDLKTKEDILGDFRSFKQASNEPARDFFVRFQVKINELLARGVWSDIHIIPKLLIQQFRQRLRLDLDIKVGDYCEDTNIEMEDMSLDEFFQVVQRVEKRNSRMQQRQGMVAAPVVKEVISDQTRIRKCHYCGRNGHLIGQCGAKKKGQKPCQAHIDWGKRVFGDEFKWNFKKSSSNTRQKEAVSMVENEKEVSQEEEEEVTVVAANHTKGIGGERRVALFKADFRDGEGNWITEVPTLADSGGCENGVNSNFAKEHGFKIYACEDYNIASHAKSATGGLITFDSYI